MKKRGEIRGKAPEIISLSFPVPVMSFPVTSFPVVQLPVTIPHKYDLEGAYILLLNRHA